MNDTFLRYFRCSDCAHNFTITKIVDIDNNNFIRAAIASCTCRQLPIVEGIFYSNKDQKAKRAVAYLQNKNTRKAFISLCDNKRRIAHALWFMVRLKPMLPISLERALHILVLLGYNKKWAWYIQHRPNLPTFFLSLLSLGMIKKPTSSILDIGAGAGHLLAKIEKKHPHTKLVGIDQSFVTLILSRHFVVSNNVALVCQNLTTTLPIQSGTIDIVEINDTLQYLQNIPLCIQETSRIMTKKGSLNIYHTVNQLEWLETGKGIGPGALEKILRTYDFASNFYSNSVLWEKIQNPSKKICPQHIRDISLQNAYGYSCIASKANIAHSITFAHPLKLHSINIDYSLDPQLQRAPLLKHILRASDFIFLSPHFDDAVLSCGALLCWLKSMKKTIYIITIFTQASSKPYSPQALSFLEGCHSTNADALFRQRKNENNDVGERIGATIINLNYTDAAWRKKNGTNTQFVYPNAQTQFSGSIPTLDSGVLLSVEKAITKTLCDLNKKSFVLFAPLGIGGHIDHVITNTIVNNLKIEKTIFWEDFPYNTDAKKRANFLSGHKALSEVFDIRTKLEDKNTLIRLYRSQLDLLFPNGKIPVMVEKYYSL
jgi:ubiquinone/menaquinone biosynthesis C-methylase UbiE/LmbE family N-acetylglucosaminyl deacetylase